jgi:hypothetical protein
MADVKKGEDRHPNLSGRGAKRKHRQDFLTAFWYRAGGNQAANYFAG